MDKIVSPQQAWQEVKTRGNDFELFLNTLSKESDRSAAIVAAVFLDNWLERIIRASYIKDPRVGSLFKNDHILQSFFSKINIAYFSGLIPSYIYHDLKLVCEIRNKFAHEVVADLEFDNKVVAQRIKRFELGPPLPEIPFKMLKLKLRIKFLLVVAILAYFLQFLDILLSQGQTPHLVEIIQADKQPYKKWALTKDEMTSLFAKFYEAKDSLEELET